MTHPVIYAIMLASLLLTPSAFAEETQALRDAQFLRNGATVTGFVRDVHAAAITLAFEVPKIRLIQRLEHLLSLAPSDDERALIERLLKASTEVSPQSVSTGSDGPRISTETINIVIPPGQRRVGPQHAAAVPVRRKR